MLAIYYAFLNIIYKHTTTAKMPIVLDSPKQQEQDNIHSDQIVNFCISHLPTNAQLILATLNYKSESNDIKIYELNMEKGLLIDSDYKEYSKYINFYKVKSKISSLLEKKSI
jgi:predicted ATPase